jgi:hypothetical protein
MRGALRRTAIAFVALAVAVGGAGCSGGEESSTARRSADRWAAIVCSDLGRWIRTAAGHVAPAAAADAALRLRAGISGAKPPETDDGLAAQGEVEKLSNAIEQRTRTADRAAITEIVAEARTALNGIRGLTPGGAVERALDETNTCRVLRG